MYMRHISLTPFGRQPVTATHLQTQRLAEAPAPVEPPDKWALLRDLTVARAQFGVTDRDLAVLAALLSFHPGGQLEDGPGLIVFPSNVSLAERAHGMAESTLRRHLAALVKAGLVLRHDSPNGKRYAVRGAAGGVEVAFGFDLRPLLVRSADISAVADETRAAEARARRLRERTVLALRDAAKLIAWGSLPEPFLARLPPLQRALRRRLGSAELEALATQARALLEDVRRAVTVLETEEMSGNDSENERHFLNSNPEPTDSELCQERQKAGEVSPEPATSPIPLGLVLKAAPDIVDYMPHGVRNWRDLITVADTVRPMLGVSPDAWSEAQRLMGPAVAAVVLACILQDAGRIRRPGGYLRALSLKAAEGGFSPGGMVMALLRRDTKAA